MKINILESFLAVARSENISNAAHSLYITQPTLSRQIKELEEELGVILFTRGNRKIILTEEGRLLRKRAEQIVGLVQKTKEEFSSIENSVGGTIYIAGGETHAFRELAVPINKLSKQYPDIHFHIFSGNADAVTERLDKGEADFGLIIEPADLSKYNYIRLAAVDRWGVLMKKDSSLACLKVITPEDLQGLPLINSRQAMKGGQLLSWLKVTPEKINLVASYNLLFNAGLLVEAGVGYAICLENIINTTDGNTLCFRPLKPALHSQVNLVWNKHQVFSKASELFLEHLRNKSLQNLTQNKN